ncbi:MAG TPA: hypothetical protein VKB84_24025 [Candidatus Binataceae bacterium]|nr:hypothetical protein [Candidatus Binataceae bacterium]
MVRVGSVNVRYRQFFTTARESTTVSMSVFDAVVSAAVALLFVLSGWLVVTGR